MGKNGRHVQKPTRFKAGRSNSATSNGEVRGSATSRAASQSRRSRKARVSMGDDVLEEASANSLEPRAPPGSAKRARMNDDGDNGKFDNRSKKARRSADQDGDSPSDDEDSAPDLVDSSDEESDQEDSEDGDGGDDDDSGSEDEDEDDGEDLVADAGARKLSKARKSSDAAADRLSSPQVLILLISAAHFSDCCCAGLLIADCDSTIHSSHAGNGSDRE